MTEFVISVLLTVAPALGPEMQAWLNRPPDTPASDVVILRFPYAAVKNHTLGPTAPTELVDLEACWFGKKRYASDWVYYDGKRRGTIKRDAHQVAVVGTGWVVRDRQGKYSAFDMTSSDWHFPVFSLADLNIQLTETGVSPVSDADFRTFEQWADERDRRRTTRSLAVLSAVSPGWLAVAGSALWFRRRAV